MTHAIATPNSAIGKTRSPIAIIGLGLVTFGLYSVYWWYAINRELRNLGEAYLEPELHRTPALSALGFGLGGNLLLPYVWTAVTTSRRIRVAQQLVGSSRTIQVGAAVGLLCAALLVGFAACGSAGWALFSASIVVAGLRTGAEAYMQVSLNEVWRSLDGSATPVPPSPVGALQAPPLPGV